MVIAVRSSISQKCVIMEKPIDQNSIPTAPDATNKETSSMEKETIKFPALDKQEFVGNCKEYRIDNNKTHLRIIGNCNKIRLNHNRGHLEIIGNTTRVKILRNTGRISYTGNCGKIYMGRESSVQEVEYVGNYGVLKIVPEDILSVDWKGKKKMMKSYEKIKLGYCGENQAVGRNGSSCGAELRTGSSIRIETTNGTNSQRSSAEILIDPNSVLCLQVKNNISLPNLVETISSSCTNSRIITNSTRIVSSTSNLVTNNDGTIWSVD